MRTAISHLYDTDMGHSTVELEGQQNLTILRRTVCRTEVCFAWEWSPTSSDIHEAMNRLSAEISVRKDARMRLTRWRRCRGPYISEEERSATGAWNVGCAALRFANQMNTT